jgi:phosphoribosylformylglycinamidine synthase subunit PurL
LEAITTGAIVGMQDMGAAGITCSTSEMSAKGNVGMVINLDKVPTRQANMKGWEILLSESQERMLIVCHKGQEQKILDVFEKWDLPCAEIGHVTDTGRLVYFQNGEMIADVPAEPLVLGGGAPVYQREFTAPQYFEKIKQYNINSIAEPKGKDLVNVAKALWKSPNIASKRWIYEQYDSMIRTNTLTTNDPSDAAIVRVKGTKKALLLTTDCNSAYVYADPYKGAMIAVSEAARNIVCSGGEPVAITNCLNFGNPYNPEVYYQFVHALQGMGDACRRFNTPVTGGNVSFYNQMLQNGETIPIYPTPTIGMLGLMEDYANQMTLNFREEGDVIFLIGKTQNDISSSEYLQRYHGVKHSPAPYFELEEEVAIQNLVAKLIQEDLIDSAHDISEGGVFVTLMESAMPLNLGFDVKISQNTEGPLRQDAALFGESQSRVVVSVHPSQLVDFELFIKNSELKYTKLGTVTTGAISIDDIAYGNIGDWKPTYENLLADVMDKN